MMLDFHETEENARNEEIEEKLSQLQNNIQHVERKIRVSDSEKKADRDESSKTVEKNELEIKRLSMQVRELQVRKERCQKNLRSPNQARFWLFLQLSAALSTQLLSSLWCLSPLADEKFIVNSFKICSRDSRNFIGKSAKEANQLLEAEVMDLQNMSKKIEHELELRKRTLLYNEQQFSEMVSNCNADFENDPTECYSVQRIRELEHEQQKVNKSITELEISESRFKRMKEQLGRNRMSCVNQLLDVEGEYNVLQEAPDVLVAAEDKPTKVSTEGKSIPGAGDSESAGAMKDQDAAKKKVRFILQEPGSSGEQLSEQERECLKMKESLEKIKDVTGVSDIQDAEVRFIEQKSTQEDLGDLRKRLSRSLHELKIEKKHLESRIELFRGANAGCPKRELEDALRAAKFRQEEQEERQKIAKLELEKIKHLISQTEDEVVKLLNLLLQSFPNHSFTSEGKTIAELGSKIEELIENIGHLNDSEQTKNIE